ncbi:MAG: glycosyltransferase [Methanobacteriota archaeon]|nr:MAG: glycosyltransferase [Euryarchaeota archaeon]
MEFSNITVIVPTLNEEQNIGRLIDKIQELYPGIHIVVVDDGSTDKTTDIVREKSKKYPNVRLLDRQSEPVKGLTISIRDGILHTETEWFIIMDGDFQHPPESIQDAIACMDQDPDLIIGRRDHIEEWPFTRKLISVGAQTLGKISLLLRRKQIPKDIMSGFFGGKTSVLTKYAENDKILEFTGYKFLFDVLKVFPKDGKICEFGYVFRNREYGTSKIGKKQIIAFLKSLI